MNIFIRIRCVPTKTIAKKIYGLYWNRIISRETYARGLVCLIWDKTIYENPAQYIISYARLNHSNQIINAEHQTSMVTLSQGG